MIVGSFIFTCYIQKSYEILLLLRHWRWRKSASNSVGTGATGGGGAAAGGTGGRCLQQLILDVTVTQGGDRRNHTLSQPSSKQPPLSRSLQGHKVQLMAKQALALGSLLVGFAGESLASSSHGFQSCSNGTPYK